MREMGSEKREGARTPGGFSCFPTPMEAVQKEPDEAVHEVA
jgi:hypothetical protein